MLRLAVAVATWTYGNDGSASNTIKSMQIDKFQGNLPELIFQVFWRKDRFNLPERGPCSPARRDPNSRRLAGRRGCTRLIHGVECSGQLATGSFVG